VIERRVPDVENVFDYISSEGWMLEAEPILTEVSEVECSRGEVDRLVADKLNRCVTIGCGLAGRCNFTGTAEYPCPLARLKGISDFGVKVEPHAVDTALSESGLDRLEQDVISRDRAIDALTTRLSEVLAELSVTAESRLEASCRLEARRQLMESACTALSIELDAAYQVTAALVAERDMLAGMLCAVNAPHEGELTGRFKYLGALVVGFRAVTRVLEDIAQAGILYDQEWLAAAREAVTSARRLVGAR
jgi:hypothetical protein